MFELSITDHFAAAHFLRGYDGACKDMHGHTWKVEVTVASEKLNGLGLVTDFRVLRGALKDILSSLDHVCLNDMPFFKNDNPSTENLAKYIYREFAEQCKVINILKVRVWESDSSSVTYHG